MKRLAIILAAAALGASAYALAPANADNGVDAQAYAAQATALVTTAPIVDRGTAWGPLPDFEIDLRPTVNETVDVAAPDLATAQADVLPIVEAALAAQAPAAPAPDTSTATVAAVTAPAVTTTDPDVQAAQDLLATAPVTDVSSDPATPLFRIDLTASLNTTIDVAAASSDDAVADPNVVSIVVRAIAWRNTAADLLAPSQS